MKHCTSALLVAAMLASSGTVFCSCGSDTDEHTVYGGDAVAYSYIVKQAHSQQAGIPLITNFKISSMHLDQVQTDHPGIFEFKEYVQELDYFSEYKGHYVYFLGLEISCLSADTVQKVNVEKIDLTINQKQYELKTPDFRLANGVEGIPANRYLDAGVMTYGDSLPAGIWYGMPTAEYPAEFSVMAYHDLTVDSIEVADYFTYQNFKVDGQNADPAKLDYKMSAQDQMKFSYTLDYQNGSSDRKIVRASRVIRFHDGDGPAAFIDGNGEYVLLGQGTDKEPPQALRNYIDSLS